MFDVYIYIIILSVCLLKCVDYILPHLYCMYVCSLCFVVLFNNLKKKTFINMSIYMYYVVEHA